jgi:signal transduction histidine kinase
MTATLPKILVVDDDDLKRYTVTHILRATGYPIIEARNGQEALRELAKKPVLVILDVKLPDISGWDICRRIKQDAATSSILVLHTSATFREAKDRAHGLENGADGYLSQPIEPDELVAHVRALLRLSEAERELQRSNQALERFAHAAAHDLREPLRMISGFLQLLSRHGGPSLDAKCNSYLAFAMDGATRMSRMVDGLLALSQIQSRDPVRERVAMGDVVRAAVANLQLRIDETGAEIVVGDLPAVVGDPRNLEQLLQNLVANALKFRGERSPRIQITGAETPEGWRFAVEDNGIGVRDDDRRRIFVLFERAHGAAVEGSGLGLAMCQAIVEKHGGRIWVEPADGEGSRFCFTLSRQDGERGGGARRAT